MIADRVDDWLPEPAVRTHHRRSAAASADELWRCARSVRLSDTGTLGWLVRWRIPGTPATVTYSQLLRRYPFALLEEGERFSISGLCGRIWTLARDYPRLGDPAEFADWREPGTARVLLAHWVQEDAAGRAQLVSESRVDPVDAPAARRLRALWAVVGGFERLIGAEPLRIAARRAEGR